MGMEEFLSSLNSKDREQIRQFHKKNAEQIAEFRKAFDGLLTDLAVMSLQNLKQRYGLEEIDLGHKLVAALATIETVSAALTTQNCLVQLTRNIDRKLKEVEIKVE